MYLARTYAIVVPFIDTMSKLEQAGREFFTNDGLAAYLVVSPKTVRGWRLTQTGPRGYKVGGLVRYRSADVEAWLEARRDEVRP